MESFEPKPISAIPTVELVLLTVAFGMIIFHALVFVVIIFNRKENPFNSSFFVIYATSTVIDVLMLLHNYLQVLLFWASSQCNEISKLITNWCSLKNKLAVPDALHSIN